MIREYRLENNGHEVSVIIAGDMEFELAPGENRTLYVSEDVPVTSSTPIMIKDISETKECSEWRGRLYAVAARGPV